MDESSNSAAFPLGEDADPVSADLILSAPESASSLALLYDVSRELTSILDREELLRRVAQRVKKIVNYHLFSVMLWNETAQLLESIFGLRYGDAIPTRLRLPLNHGITGTSASERRAIRVADTLNDPRKRVMTIRDLITMTSGYYCDDDDDAAPGNESTMMDQEAVADWTRYTLAVPLATAPGGRTDPDV